MRQLINNMPTILYERYDGEEITQSGGALPAQEEVIMEVEPDDLSDSFEYHEELNSRLWDGEEMRLDVRVYLLKNALAFAKFLDVPGLLIEDVIFTGSNAAYNYTDYSDLDVHLIVDFDESVCPEIADNFFNTKRFLWNDTHDVRIRDYPVELYVEDVAQPVTANGVYSLLTGEWLKKPTKSQPSFDDSSVFAKVEQLAGEIDTVLGKNNPLKAQVSALSSRITRMRRAGIAQNGEYSVENLAYKALRNLGYLKRLWDADVDAEDRDLSLESRED